MAQDDPENSAKGSDIDGAESDRRKGVPQSGKFAHLTRRPRTADASDSEAASPPEEIAPDAESDGAEALSESAFSQPPRKSGLSLGRIILGLIALAAAAIAGAFALRDKNEGLRALTDAIETAAEEPLSVVREKASGIFETKKTPPPSVSVKEPAPVAEVDNTPAPRGAPHAEPEARPKVEAEAAAAPVETPPKSPAVEAPPAQVRPSPAEASPPREAAVQNEDREALLKRIGEVERLAQSALKTAEEARAAHAASADKPAPDAESLSERDYLTALEGRIDELGGEIKALREKLEAPKSELRAPQESSEVKAPPGKKGGAAELVVVAQSLNQEIEKGRPYSVELAALSSLGADPELLAALAPSAEKGAMTPEQLLHGFEPVARRLQAIDTPKSTSSYLDRVMLALGRMVRVRPIDEPPTTTVSDRVETIRSALKHNDVAAAAASFDLLPSSAKTEESAFGELLRQRRDAEKASADLLSGAIAALGRNKS